MSEAKPIPGSMHVHWPDDDGWPTNVTLDIWPPTFMLEFGQSGEDYGGCIIIGWGGCPREKDEVTQTYDPKVMAPILAAAPDLLEACRALTERDWAGHNATCVCCRQSQHRGHKPDCKYVAAKKLADSLRSEPR